MLSRQVFQWAVFLLLLIAAGGWYAAEKAWERRDELLLAFIREDIAQKFPDWDVEIADAEVVNVRGQVRLTDIQIRPKGDMTAVVHIPECLITLDPDLLVEQRQILIRRLRVSHPTVTLIRNADGVWNWQKLGRPAPSDQTPEVEIEHGTFVVRVEATAGLPETEITSREVALSLLPAGVHRYLIEGATEIDGAGGLRFTGRVDLNSGSWELAGKADGLDVSPSLLGKATALSPAVKRQVAELTQSRETLTPGAASPVSIEPPGGLIRPASQSRQVSDGVSRLSLPNLGLVANIAVDFALRSDGRQEMPDYRVVAKVMEGEVTKPLSPVPLSGLEGEFLIENDRIVIHEVKAAGGDSRLYLDGEVRKQQDRTVKQFNVHATNLWLDPQIRGLLSPEHQRMFDLISPSGWFTVKARYDSEDAKPLQLHELTAHNCRIKHALFPYPVTGITGTISQEIDEQAVEHFKLDLQGTAAGRTVELEGEIQNPGQAGAAEIYVEVSQFPVDRRLTEAIVAPEHQPFRRAMESLNLTGLADLRIKFARDGGAGQRYRMGIDADVTQATLNYERFPYRVDQLSGHVHFNPWSKPVWSFTGLAGRHGETTLKGEAAFDLTQRPGTLALAITGENGQVDPAIDRALYDATIAADPMLQEVWNALNPKGRVHVHQAEITWTPGQTPRIVLPSIRLEQGSIQLSSFPYRLDNVTADLGWQDGLVDLRRVTGRHNETSVVIEDRGKGPAYFEMTGEHDYVWRLHLPDIVVSNLDPGGEFAAAVPRDVRAVLTQLNPRGPIDAQLGVDLQSYPEQGEIITALWKVEANLEKDRLFAGLELTDVTGTVKANVRWDGELEILGGIDFQQARTLDMTFTNLRGPFRVVGSKVTVGSEAVFQNLKVPSDEQFTASLYDGVVRLNSVSRVDTSDPERSVYQMRIDLENADLRQWAKEWELTDAGVTGTVNGLMNLSGQGSSPLALRGENCWVQVTDAQLGELPQMAQLLGQLTQFQQPGKTAFTYAYADFSVEGGRFEFGSPDSQSRGDKRVILLDGDMMKMVGRGYIPFAPGIDQRMNLNFLSKVADRNRLLQNIPFVSSLTKVADNWIRIQVTGSPSRPEIYVLPQVPIGNLNNVLIDLLNTVEVGLNPARARTTQLPRDTF